MTKLNILTRTCICLVVVTALPVFGGPILTDGTWYSFDFGSVGSMATGGISGPMNSAPGAPPWTFTASSPGYVITVTDGFLQGDVLDVLDFGMLVGTTSPTPPDDDHTCASNPDACLADPLMSHGMFVLGAGSHSIQIRAAASPFNIGTGFFRVTPAAAPEPGTYLLLGPALLGLAYLRCRKRKNS